MFPKEPRLAPSAALKAADLAKVKMAAKGRPDWFKGTQDAITENHGELGLGFSLEGSNTYVFICYLCGEPGLTKASGTATDIEHMSDWSGIQASLKQAAAALAGEKHPWLKKWGPEWSKEPLFLTEDNGKTWHPTEWAAAAYSNDLDNLLWSHGQGCNQYKSNKKLNGKIIDECPYVIDRKWSEICDVNGKPKDTPWVHYFKKNVLVGKEKDLASWVLIFKNIWAFSLEAKAKRYVEFRGSADVSESSADEDDDTPAQVTSKVMRNLVRKKASKLKIERQETIQKFNRRSRSRSPSPSGTKPSVAYKKREHSPEPYFQFKCLTCNVRGLAKEEDEARCACPVQNIQWLHYCQCGEAFGPPNKYNVKCKNCGYEFTLKRV